MKKSNRIIIFGFLLLSNYNNAQNQAPGLDIIGKGYDIFGEYANNSSMKRYSLFVFPNSLVRSNSYNYALPDYLILENISDHRIKQIEGTTLSEYSENIQRNLNLKTNALLFSGSFTSQFSNNSNLSNELFYYTYMDANTKWRISIDMRDSDKLIQLLDPLFKQDLANLPPAKLFERYGTHFIASAYLGGRADCSSATKISSSYTQDDIKIAI
jgi:hypothetical protein